MKRILLLMSIGLFGCTSLQSDKVRLARPKAGVKRAFTFQRQSMHTLWNFTLVASRESEAQRAFDEACTEVDRLDEALAMWKPASEVAAVNRAAGTGQAVAVSADTAKCVELSLKTAAWSKGAFDPTVGPLTQSWYYALQKKERVPPAEVARLRKLVDWRKVRLAQDAQGAKVSLPRKGMMLDLGGIAKGYAQDKAAAILRAHGITDFLMNAGGQIYAAGTREDGLPWKVGVENPRDGRRVLAVLSAQDLCLATSGDYEQFTVFAGRRYHHLLDPKSGLPTSNGCISATAVLQAKGEWPAAMADALGTAAFVLGPGSGRAFLEAHGASGLLVSEGKLETLHATMTDDLVGRMEILP